MKVRVRKRIAGEVPVPIVTEFIKLESFLKLAGAVETGGMAKTIIQDGEVMVNDAVCVQRGKKLHPGDRVLCLGATYVVTNP